MAVDAALPLPLVEPAATEVVEIPAPLPVGVIGDATTTGLPLAPLAPVELTPVPGIGRLARAARATLALLAHPYPHRAPRPPLTRDEHLALAANERARLERERQAYRTMALGGPFR